MGEDPRGLGYRVPRRDRQLHPRARALVRRVRPALHERPGDHRRELRRHRGPRRALLRVGSREGRVRHDLVEVRRDAGTRRGRRAGGGLLGEGRAVGPRRARRRAAARRAAGGGRDTPAPALRLPAAQEALPPLHPRVRLGDVRLLGRGLPLRRPQDDGELGPGAHRRVLLRGRVDAAHRRRPVHPHGGDHPAAAREHGAARWRNHRAPRPRLHPGLDRHPDALQHPPRLPADAAHRGVRRLRELRAGGLVADRLVGPLRVVLGQPDEGLLRRRGDGGERVAVQAAAADRQRQLRLLDGPADAHRQGEGLHHRGREPRRRQRELTRQPPRAGEARLARRARPDRDRVRRLLVRQPGDRIRGARHRADSDRGLLHAGGGPHREGRLVHEHPAADPVALARRSSRRRTRAPTSGSTSTSAS